MCNKTFTCGFFSSETRYQSAFNLPTGILLCISALSTAVQVSLVRLYFFISFMCWCLIDLTVQTGPLYDLCDNTVQHQTNAFIFDASRFSPPFNTFVAAWHAAVNPRWCPRASFCPVTVCARELQRCAAVLRFTAASELLVRPLSSFFCYFLKNGADGSVTCPIDALTH